MSPADLEGLVHRRLKALPLPAAPDSLRPRIMAAVRARLGRPWYTRAFFTWPLAGQATCVVALLALAAALAAWLPVSPAGHVLATLFGNDARNLIAAAAHVGAAVNAIEVMRRALIEPVYAYALVLSLTMCATSAVLGAAVARVALGGAIRS